MRPIFSAFLETELFLAFFPLLLCFSHPRRPLAPTRFCVLLTREPEPRSKTFFGDNQKIGIQNERKIKATLCLYLMEVLLNSRRIGIESLVINCQLDTLKAPQRINP
jgi:hypothetical protein